ncbi:MAG TPA: YcfL family protein [Candidatus Binatia bacterium]|nr:YcfL family protein [Candidatus Binatia bacterium]
MKTKLAGLVAITLAVAGCHNTMNSVENAQKEGQRNMISDQRVVTDTGLSRAVSVVGVNTAMTPGGVLRVQVELLNRTRSLHPFSYRFEWFDANGMQVGSGLSPVVPDQIEGGESKFISAVAPSPICKDFRLKLLEAH